VVSLIGAVPASGASASPSRTDPAPADAQGIVSYVGEPRLSSDGKLVLPKPQEQLAAAGDARQTARALDQRSFNDPLARAATTPPKSPPSEPNGPDVEDCLNSEGARNPFGRVYNRFMWCQRYEVIAERWTVGPGKPPGGHRLSKMTMKYSAVAYGREDGGRNIKIFFRGDDLDIHPKKGYIRENSTLYQRILCKDGDSGCGTSDAYVGRQLKDWVGNWTSWTVSSDKGASTARDYVLKHKWAFEGYVVDSWNARLLGSESVPRSIRCDSAAYFGKKRSAACIFDDVIPHLQYSRHDLSPVKEVAAHIRCAQEEPWCPEGTYPRKGSAKLIPGKFRPGERDDLWALHRVRSAKTNSPIADANRRVVRAACALLPKDVYDTAKGQECDEYPFASTLEGAACCDEGKFDWDYSIKGVLKADNGCGGNALKKYYRDDRILYEQDGFFVHITDTPPGGPGYCDTVPPEDDESDDGGGSPPVPVDDPPLVGAGPDLSGDEGSPLTLSGFASDKEVGTPHVSWTFQPVSGVDPGATCSFGSTNRAQTTVTCTDDGVFQARITASDGVNSPVSDTALVTLHNVAPRIGPTPRAASRTTAGKPQPAAAPEPAAAEPPFEPGIVTPAPWQLFRAGQEVKLTAAFSEPAQNDTHTCVTNWDDGSTSTYKAEDLTCQSSHTFTHAGMYTIKTTVTDDDTGAGQEEVMVIVYDPKAGVARGNGWLDAPGVGGFDFTSSYPTPAATVPDGATTFAVPPELNLNLRNHQRLEWLVVTRDGKVAIKGRAERIPGQDVGFVLYGYVGCPAGQSGACQRGPHRLRMVVWDSTAHGPIPAGVPTVYDNRPGRSFDVDVADPQNIHAGVMQILRPPMG
jgi:hypothetical protein